MHAIASIYAEIENHTCDYHKKYGEADISG